MRINTNISALRAQANLSKVNDAVSASMAKLSSGFRITRAADDAAGLGIANVLRADIRSLGQASRNSEQANAVLNIAEGRRVSEVAETLSISQKAVESHKYRIMRVIGATDRVDLCRWAIREGLIEA